MRGLWRYYAYLLVSEITFTGSTWIIFLQFRGFSLHEIGLAGSVFYLAPVSLEIVSGSLADTAGRKWSLAIGSLCVAASAVLMFTASDLWRLLLAVYVSGASSAFRSGAQQAYLYDVLAEQGESDRFVGTFGRLLSLSYLVFAASTWVGAALAEITFAWPYTLELVVGLTGFYLATSLREPRRARPIGKNLIAVTGETLRIVRERPGLITLLILSASLWSLAKLYGLFAQAMLSEQGMKISAIGLTISVALLLSALGSWLSPRLAGRVHFRAWTIGATAAFAAAALGLGSSMLVVGLIAFLLAEFYGGLYEPILQNQLNRQATSAHRATILSFAGFLLSANMIWAFPLIAWAADRWDWISTFSLACVVVILVLLTWIITDARRSTSSARPKQRAHQ